MMVVFLLFTTILTLLLGVHLVQCKKSNSSQQQPLASQRSSTLTPTKSQDSQAKTATPVNPRSPNVRQQPSRNSLKFDRVDLKSNKSAATDENATNLDSVIGTEDNPLKDQRVIAKLRGSITTSGTTSKARNPTVTEPCAKTAKEQIQVQQKQPNSTQTVPLSNKAASKLLDPTMDTASPSIFEPSGYFDENLRRTPSSKYESRSKHVW